MIKYCLATASIAVVIVAALTDSRGRASSEPPLPGSSIKRGPGDDSSLILFRRGTLDTRGAGNLDFANADYLASLIMHTALSSPLRKRTRVIQFVGPIERQWIEGLRATGLEVIGYVPNNAYLIRGTEDQFRVLRSLEAVPIQWFGDFHPLLKIDPLYDDNTLAAGNSPADVEIELIDSDESAAAVEYIDSVTLVANAAPTRFLKFLVLSVTVPLDRLLAIASFDEVLFIKQRCLPVFHDERGAQIVAGNILPDRKQPVGPGYLDWIASMGLSSQSDFAIDFVDTGLDRGFITMIHPDFLNPDGQSRVAYVYDYTGESHSDDRRGHGTLVASAACGNKSSGLTDGAGYFFGVGVAPAVKLGASRIFRDNGTLPFQLSLTKVASAAYAAGARISNNSWGKGGNDYDAAAQEYDALARDSEPSVPGNQEMTFVFSAGNSGAGGKLSSPGTGKNIISVAASENFRPEGFDSCNLDGLGGIGPDGADSALDILRFSSGGPTRDGRAKPDLAAPGTHIYGAASQSQHFYGDGICPGITLFQPPGQQLYTWSSGTSLAAAHVSGAAALLRQFVVSRGLLGGKAPSPAMTKAYLANSASYLTGENAGGNLPADRQGWGLVNLGRAFDDAKRLLIDQTTLLTETGQTIEVKGSLADRTRPLRITLAWTDAPGTLVAAPWVNDLDLEVLVGSAALYLGNNFGGEFSVVGGTPDNRNNLESVFLPPSAIPEGADGNFTIGIRAANIAGDGVPGNGLDLDQDFALVVYNIAPAIDPPRVPVITAASYLKKTLTITGRDFTASARVEINGGMIERVFAYDAATSSLTIIAKRKKLNLTAGSENQIVIIENDRRSLPYILRL